VTILSSVKFELSYATFELHNHVFTQVYNNIHNALKNKSHDVFGIIYKAKKLNAHDCEELQPYIENEPIYQIGNSKFKNIKFMNCWAYIANSHDFTFHPLKDSMVSS
jgi:hypothetical protein